MNMILALTMIVFSAAGIRADYGGGSSGAKRNVIALPASLSKAHPWVGSGNQYPDFVPFFFKAPTWVPGYDPTYSASWVPHAPKPRSQSYNSRGDDLMYASNGFINLDSSIPQGFGPPKGSSISSGAFGGQGQQYNLRRQSSGNRESFINFPDRARRFQSQSPLYNQQFPTNNRLQNLQFHNFRPTFNPSFDQLSQNVLTNPLQLQALENNSKRFSETLPRHPVVGEVKASPRTRNPVGFRHLTPTLHVGSRHPGAASPETLGINYNQPKLDDIHVRNESPRSTSPFRQTLRTPSNSVPARVPDQSFERVVSSFYTHSQ